MIKIEPGAWKTMVDHAQSTFPDECCGVMIGTIDGDTKNVTAAIAVENSYKGKQEDRYEIRPRIFSPPIKMPARRAWT